MLADAFGGVLEVAANVAVGALVGGALVAAAGLTVATGGIGACVLAAAVSLAVGVGMNASGIDEEIRQFCDDLANDLFPPTVCAHISSGSPNVLINGLPAVRAAGTVTSDSAALPADETPEGTFLDIARGFFSELWRPTVATPAPGAIPKPSDHVTCERHSPMPVQYIAEGSDRVFINGQPAARSGDRSTCDAVVVSSGLISPNVRIGGERLVVRPIRSGKTPGIGLAVSALMMLKGGPRKFVSNLPCMLFGGVNTFVVSQVTAALGRAMSGSPHPVHAATGAKVLGGVEELDVVLPGLIPIEWQRFYNSRDERRDGLFGAGWSVPFEVSVVVEPHPEGGERLVYTDEQARQIDMGAIALGGAVFSAGEGLAVKRHDDGRLLIESEDGLYRLFEPTSPDPSRLQLSQLGDRNDNRVHLKYDAAGRLVGLRDSLHVACLDVAYSTRWPQRVERLERVFDDGSHETVASYAYDESGDLAEVTDAMGNLQRRFVYNADRRMVEHQLPGGLRCFYEWGLIDDREWRVVRHYTDEGDDYRFDYDLDAGRTVVTDGLNRRSERRWNAQHQITEYIDNLGLAWRFAWNDARQLLGATDPQEGEWRYTYDDTGNLETTEDPLGRCELTQWLEHWSLPRLETDAAGNTWQYRYDARGNCTHAVDPLGHITQFRYDGYGQVIEIIDATGKSRKQHWNEFGQLTESIDCSGYPTRFSYDRRGFLQGITDALGERTVYRHDALGRLFQRVLPDGRVDQYEWALGGRLTRHTDPTGASTLYEYDRRGQFRQRTDALRREVRFAHDAYGRLHTLTNENGEHYRFAWDAGDRLVVQQDLDSSQRRYAYDGLNNVVRIRQLASPNEEAFAKDSIIHELKRDAAGRLIAKVTADGETAYTYDARDQLIHIVFTGAGAEQHSVGFAYDALSQLVSESGATGVLQHHYDELGNRVQSRLPDGRWLNHLRYGGGHVHQINLDGLVICDVERDRLHREVLRTQGQLNTRTQYDRAGRLRSRARRFIDKPRQLPAHWATEYDYDPADNLMGHSERNGPRTFRTYLRYDATGRLMAREGEPATETELYAYDPAANLLDAQGSGHISHNRLLRYQDKRYRYDGFGRMIEKRSVRHGTQRFAYDNENRLIAVHNDNGDIVRMSYDPLGRRVEKSEYNRHGRLVNTTHFTWDGLRLLHERCYDKQSLYLYVEESHEPLARIDGIGEFQTVHHFHNAPNGQPEALTEANGDLVWTARYQVWGNTTHEDRAPHTDPQNLRFQGQYLDRETGLHYNTFRFYDPDVGRFTTPDPIGLAGGINLYRYAPNAVGWVDPWGWSCVRVRHYTNRKGLEGIKESGVIKARDNNRVYLEPAASKPLSPKRAVEQYGIKDGRGRDYVETDVPAERLEWIKNPSYHRKELTVFGDLKIENPTFTKRK